MTSNADRLLMLRLARDTIAAYVAKLPAPIPVLEGALAVNAGAFVSLHASGQLRGCIGHIDMDQPLGHVIPRCAIAACSADPRFPPVTAAELAGIDVELSLLGRLEAMSAPMEIEIGRHGLLVERDGLRGLLLPQVATEWNWDCETFLAHACRKAGLPRDAWKNGARLWRFEAEVFGEDLR